jgi:hypothetical protein
LDKQALQGDFTVIEDKDFTEVMASLFSSLKIEIDLYFDAKNLPILVRVLNDNQERISFLKYNGARLRCLTEINRDNLPTCKDLMKNFELFHTPLLTGSFAIADNKEYLGYLVSKEEGEKLLQVTNTSFIDTQKFLVNSMIDRAVPAAQRIRDIGKGAEEEFMETIRDPLKIKSLISSLVQSAVFEIAVLFSTKNSFLAAEREGILQEISNASAGGVKVKILVMQDEAVKEISDTKLKMPDLNVQVNYLQQLLPTKITTILVDQARILTVEVNDDTKETFNEAIGLCTYSNSESTVFSNASIFESLWMQSEVDKQSKARQAYFQLFKGFNLKNEIYNRRWGSSGKQQEQ